MKNLVCLFSKPAIEEVSKTRLSKDLNMEDTLLLSKNLLERNIELLKESEFDFLLSTMNEDFKKILEKTYGVNTLVQRGKGLGERMYYTVLDGLEYYESVTIMGADIVNFDSSLLKEALNKIPTTDMVVSNTLDGGYSFISLKKAYKSLFYGKTYSHKNVFIELMESANSLGLKTNILRETMDIDDIYGLAYYIAGGKVKKTFEDNREIHFNKDEKTFVFYKEERLGKVKDKVTGVSYDLI